MLKKLIGLKETIRLKLRKKYIRLTCNIRRRKLKNLDFTIISNNCWAGFIYQSYGLKYTTPTIGLFIMPDDYIKFITNLKKYLNLKLDFIAPEKSKWYAIVNNFHNYGKYPVAKLGDIEIFFMHYSSNEIAEKKWNERKERINFKKIIYKFSDMNFCTENNIIDFQKLDLKNKICFVSYNKKKLNNEYTFTINKCKKTLKASYEPFGNSHIINIDKFINNIRDDSL